ncbi:energy transducer TonB [Variovorax boronicumulans]|uniref:energy transducer TonB n=1 Tax=Variovorax boronicumulans TaxID=436515 RepID=UPI001C58B4B2
MSSRSLPTPILSALLLSIVLAGCTMPRKPPIDDEAPTPSAGPIAHPPTIAVEQAAPPVVAVAPAPPPAQAAVVLPVPLRRPAPVFPAALTESGIDGTVVASFFIDTQGVPETVRILRTPHPLFDAAVVEAVRQWRYEPARDAQGRAVRHQVQVPFRFRLED